MFAPGDFNSPAPKRPSLLENRTLGALVLLICIILCLVLAIGLDTTVFNPYNATHAVTQTWEAAHPDTATPAATPRPSNPRPVRSPAPNNSEFQADESISP